jgi:hypothetical protein
MAAIKATEVQEHYSGMCTSNQVAIFLSDSGLHGIGANCAACLLTCGAKVIPRYLCGTYCTLHEGDRDLERQLASFGRRWPSAFTFRPNPPFNGSSLLL